MSAVVSERRFGEVLLRAVDPGLSRDHLLITFSPLQPDLGPPHEYGFGEPTFAKRGLSAVHVIGLSNHWYQTPAMAEALDHVRTLAAPFARRVAYGSSMGAYGALRYAAELGASRVIAISPQWSIDSGRPPHDARWATRLAAIGDFAEDMIERLQDAPEAIVLYDPFDPDAAHVAEYRKVRPDFRYAPLSFSGHFPAGFLTDLGILGDTVAELVASPRPDLDGLKRAIRERRRQSSVFWSGLSGAAERRGHRTLALSAAERASRLQPTVDRVSRQAELHMSAGFVEEALALLRREVMRAPSPRDGLLHLSNLIHYLHQVGRSAEARSELARHEARWPAPDARAERDPARVDEFMLLGRLYAAVGDWPGVVECMQAVLRTQPDQLEALRTASGALMVLGYLKSALFLARRAAARAPENGEYQLHLGSLLLGVGEAAEAIAPLRRAVALGAGIAAYEGLAEALERRGEPYAAAHVARQGLAAFTPTPVLERLAAWSGALQAPAA